jgi:hypothetical protein
MTARVVSKPGLRSGSCRQREEALSSNSANLFLSIGIQPRLPLQRLKTMSNRGPDRISSTVGDPERMEGQLRSVVTRSEQGRWLGLVAAVILTSTLLPMPGSHKSSDR